jgi:hypothetical protein
MWILVNSDAAPLKALDVSNYLSDQKDGEVSELKHDPDLLHIIKLSMSQIIREIVIQPHREIIPPRIAIIVEQTSVDAS